LYFIIKYCITLFANSNELFTVFHKTHLHGNKFKLVKPKSVSVGDSNFFFKIVSSIFETLCPIAVVTAESIYSFKRRLESFDFSNFIIL
jgi:hypothetical protein